MWLGPVPSEARAAFGRAREHGLSPVRALVIGQIASFKEGWTFRRNLAAKVGCAIRTVARAIAQAKELGLLGTARAKKDEIPPGLKEPLPCGWSHRWIFGWGKAGKAVEDAVHEARARWLVKVALHERKPAQPTAPIGVQSPAQRPAARPEYQRRTWTAAELDAELERLNKPPPE